MPKFAANLTMMFTEVPFIERFALAKEAGFKAVEYLFPYDYPVDDLKAQLQKNGLQQVLFNLPCGDWAKGERGIAATPDRSEEFFAGVDKAIEYALALGVTQLNCLVGKKVAAFDENQHMATLSRNIRYASNELKKRNIRLLIEAINHFDVPGFILNKTEQVLSVIDEAASSNILMQYDVYHAQREEGELINTLRKNIERIGHIQIADNPGRHQPGTGEINYRNIFKELDAMGYQGFIGLEYVPSLDTKSSLSWIKEYGYQL